MHRIERLPPATRSSVRSQIYHVLAHYASGGNHGPISVKGLFLMAADGLVDAGIIERPDFLGGRGFGGQKFVQLTEKRQPKIFPDYGIPSEIADLMRQTFWELFLQGILAPAPKQNPLQDSIYPGKHQDFWLYLDCVMLTPYGVQILIDSENRIQVHDPDGYLANFWSANPLPDREMMRLLKRVCFCLQRWSSFGKCCITGCCFRLEFRIKIGRAASCAEPPLGRKFGYDEYTNF